MFSGVRLQDPLIHGISLIKNIAFKDVYTFHVKQYETKLH